jgi:hypothetical protein
MFFQIRLFSLVEETNVSLKTAPFVVEAGVSYSLFLCENRVSFDRILPST